MSEETAVKAPDPDNYKKDVIVAAVPVTTECVTYDPKNKPVLFPMKRLFYSRKFMVLLLDVIISTILYFVGKYSASGIADDIGFLIGSYQPVALLMIYAIAQEDVAHIHRDNL